MLRKDMTAMEEIKIVKVSEQDISELVKIEKQCFSVPWSENSFKTAFEDSYSQFFVAKTQLTDCTVGFSGMYIAAKAEGYVYNIAVIPEYRKRGIGTELMRSLLEYSDKNKLEYLSLEVRESNSAAISVYKNLGFKKIGVRKNFYELPVENAVIMTCYFNC